MNPSTCTSSPPRYVLVTPARNEARVIQDTIESILRQSHLPVLWLIISDSSTDGTDDIVKAFASRYPFIRFERVEHNGARSFAAKARAFNVSIPIFSSIAFDYIGNLDADVTPTPNYFELLLHRLQHDTAVGLAGGLIVEETRDKRVGQQLSPDSVAGALQMFRRQCWQSIGGYLPLPYGGIDSAAEIMVRMYGWKVVTFFDLQVPHRGAVGARNHRLLRRCWRDGWKYYSLGYHPLFQIARCVYAMASRPYIIGSLLTVLAYATAYITRAPIHVPPTVAHYVRTEQLLKLRSFCVHPIRAIRRRCGTVTVD